MKLRKTARLLLYAALKTVILGTAAWFLMPYQ